MRLTYRDSTVPHINEKGELWEAYSDRNYNEIINKLAAYEDAEEQGRLVPVVQCEGCKHWKRIKDDCFLASCELDALVRSEDFFCADGERRIDNG